MVDSKFTPQSRKRPLERNASHTQASPRYKIRVLTNELRPHFIEVLKTPDFQNCKAAGHIREGMKALIDLYKEMISESIKLETRTTLPNNSSSNIPNGPKPGVNPPPLNGAPIELTGHRSQGTYIVGGSAFGWNFIMFNSRNKAVYTGLMKEDFRAANPKSTEKEKH
ncbi:hypothetical protein CASFOL_031140 [Castilleja foliolosa]|uniref:Uncharacterized protein n=1 Tax=Castilleja foliolosa TaxID=1961234 RepID=A0ABD3C4L1_9LAMI